MARKARTMVSKLRRQSRVRPYRERTEITPLLATNGKSQPEIKATTAFPNGLNGTKTNGVNGTSINIQNQLHPIDEDFLGEFNCNARAPSHVPFENINSIGGKLCRYHQWLCGQSVEYSARHQHIHIHPSMADHIFTVVHIARLPKASALENAHLFHVHRMDWNNLVHGCHAHHHRR